MAKEQQVALNDRNLMDSAKTLRSNIDFAGIDEPIRSVTITSAQKGDGKTMVACALAIAEANAGRKTLIIDNDFRAPQVASRLHIRGTAKMSDVLNATEETLMQYCLETKTENLYMLDISTRRSDPVEVLSSKKYEALLKLAIEQFDFVVVDTPPLGLFIDSALVAPKTDGAVIVILSGKDSEQTVKNMLSQLEKANARILGAVLNGDKKKHTDYYYYYSKKDHKTKKKAVH